MQTYKKIVSLILCFIFVTAPFPLSDGKLFAENEKIPLGYKKIAENSYLALYLSDRNLALKIEDKQSGYIWSSTIDQLVEGENNQSWSNFMQSGISIDYFEKGKPKMNRTDLISSSANVEILQREGGFLAKVRFHDLGLGFDVYVSLEENQLVVHIPNSSIVEGEQYSLASVFVYPFLGATRKDEIPGYIFVPDGSGALISFNDNKNKFKFPYEAKIYGENDGIDLVKRRSTTKLPYKVNFPVFGIVHRENENGLFGIIEQGKYNAKIIAYPNGATTQYNWATVNFLFRESYLQPTSRSLGGVVVFEKDRNIEDVKMRYFFTNGKSANYIGMAKIYQKYLLDHGMLQKTGGIKENIPLQLDILGAETKNGLFFKRMVPMTTVDQAEYMINDLYRNGIEEMLVVYKGWNKGGFSGRNPFPISFESKLGSRSDFERLKESLHSKGIPLYFYDDYTIGYDESKRFSARGDAAIRIDKTVMSFNTFMNVYEKYYYLSSAKTADVVEKNLRDYEKNNLMNIAVNNTSHILFSEVYKDSVRSRAKNAEHYQTLLDKLNTHMDSVAMYTPNDYLLGFTDHYFHIPMYSSQYIFFDQTVPFTQIVLKGFVDYFAPYANFYANQHEELLRLIEFGAYPSFYLTFESSYKLKYTNSSDVYTSTYGIWKDEILEQYKTINSALKHVIGATIENREIVKPGISKVSYSNGVEIFVNYTNSDVTLEGVRIPKKGFQVKGVN